MARPAIERIDSGALPYLLARPATAAGPAPLLFFLHGYDEAAPLDIESALTRHGPLRRCNPELVTTRFNVVAPQLPRAGDLWHLHADAVADVRDDVLARTGADPRRSYLTGFSFGGNGVFDLGLAQPEAWSALWAVDPTRVPRQEPRQPVWLSFGEVARRGKQAFIAALALEPAGIPPAGRRLYLDQGEDHVGSATRAYGDERIYRWLLEAGG